MAGAIYSRVEQKTDGTSSVPTNHRRRAVAVATLFIFGFLPLILYFIFVHDPFTSKPVVCGSRETTIGESQDYGSKSSGAQSIFTIDRVSSQSFPFWEAKLIDTIWDLFVGRGMQFLASALSYTVLSDALLRAIQSSPVPYRTFSGISINGASATTVIALVRDLGRHSRRRAVFLFTYSALAIIYVLAMPTLLSTMAGYISTASAYVQVPETSQYVPNSDFVPGFSFEGLSGVANGTCMSYKDAGPADARMETQLGRCNSTCWTVDLDDRYHSGYWAYVKEHHNIDGCAFFRNETYDVFKATYDEFGFVMSKSTETETYNCNDTITIDVAGKTFPYLTAVRNSSKTNFQIYTSGTYCYGTRAYEQQQIDANTKCLPDVGSGSDMSTYRWGFSSLLSSIVLIVHALWCISMFAVWMDAQKGGVGGGGGGGLDQLRALFTVAAVACEVTEMSAAQLAKAPRGAVEKVLDGGGAGSGDGGGGDGGGAKVGAELFEMDEGGKGAA